MGNDMAAAFPRDVVEVGYPAISRGHQLNDQFYSFALFLFTNCAKAVIIQIL
jgi:hypothetical protein